MENIEAKKLIQISEGGKDALLVYLEKMGRSVGVKDIKTILKSYGSTLSDQLFMGNNSRINKTIQSYEAQGYSREDAEKKTIQQLFVTDPMAKISDNLLTDVLTDAAKQGYDYITS